MTWRRWNPARSNLARAASSFMPVTRGNFTVPVETSSLIVEPGCTVVYCWVSWCNTKPCGSLENCLTALAFKPCRCRIATACWYVLPSTKGTCASFGLYSRYVTVLPLATWAPGAGSVRHTLPGELTPPSHGPFEAGPCLGT